MDAFSDFERATHLLLSMFFLTKEGIVRDLLDLVHNVILIKCIFRSGNPGGSGFWVKGMNVVDNLNSV